MLKIWSWFVSQNRTLSRALAPEKKVKIEGIKFRIRKLSPLHYLAGYKSIQNMWTTYLGNVDKQIPADFNMEKLKAHYIDVFTAAVIEPKLSRKEDEESLKDALYVGALFNNWDICQRLYDEIMVFTYGKKKVGFSSFLRRKLLN